MANFFANRSSTAAVIEVTAALSVGSGTGAKPKLWFDGTGIPVRLLSANFSGAVPPTHQMQIGTLSAVRPKNVKSSAPVTGGETKVPLYLRYLNRSTQFKS